VRHAALIAVVASLGVAVPSATATQPPLRVVGFAWIGSFKVRGGDPASARRAFGPPSRVQAFADSCQLSWPGISIGFYTLLDKPQCGPTTPFGGATITRPWVTERGLRQGDSVVKAKRLYPAARKAAPGASRLSLVVRFSQATGEYGLTARVSHGRVTTLYVEDPQGGE
jgi:hypothetical protein